MATKVKARKPKRASTAEEAAKFAEAANKAARKLPEALPTSK